MTIAWIGGVVGFALGAALVLQQWSTDRRSAEGDRTGFGIFAGGTLACFAAAGAGIGLIARQVLAG